MPISVGMRAGSHFNVPYRLEKYLPLEHIKTVNTGGFGARLKALLDGEVEAASLLPPQIAMAEQLGLRKIIEDRFKTLWWVPDSATPEVVHRLHERAGARRKGARSRSRKIPAAVGDRDPAGIPRPQPGTIRSSAAAKNSSTRRSPREDFDEVFKQVERWGLAQFVKDRSAQTLSYPSA